MSDEQIKTLLGQLQQELKSAEAVDDETAAMARDVEREIHDLIGGQGESEGVLGRAAELEARFAVEHPTAERFVREIIDALGKLGI